MGLCNMTHAHDTCILFLMHAKDIQPGQSKEFCSFPTMIFKILVHPHQTNLSSQRHPTLGDVFVGFLSQSAAEVPTVCPCEVTTEGVDEAEFFGPASQFSHRASNNNRIACASAMHAHEIVKTVRRCAPVNAPCDVAVRLAVWVAMHPTRRLPALVATILRCPETETEAWAASPQMVSKIVPS